MGGNDGLKGGDSSNEGISDGELVVESCDSADSSEVAEELAARIGVLQQMLPVIGQANAINVKEEGPLISERGVEQIVKELMEAGKLDMVMEHAGEFARFPFAEAVFADIAVRDSKLVLKNASGLEGCDGEDMIIEKAVRGCIELETYDAGFVFGHVGLFANQPYAEEVLLVAAAKSPRSAFEYAGKYLNQPYARAVLLVAAEHGPHSAFFLWRKYSDADFDKDILFKAVEHSSERTFAGGLQNVLEDKLGLPFTAELFSAIASKWPLVILGWFKFQPAHHCLLPWQVRVIDIAVDCAADKVPVELLNHLYIGHLVPPHREEVVGRVYKNALNIAPVDVLEEKIFTLKSNPDAREMFMKAIEEGDVAVSKWFVVNFDRYSDEEGFAPEVFEAAVRRVLTGVGAGKILLDEKTIKSIGMFPWAEEIYSDLARNDNETEAVLYAYGNYVRFPWGRKVFDLAYACSKQDKRDPVEV
jgi:hypothetical protein